MNYLLFMQIDGAKSYLSSATKLAKASAEFELDVKQAHEIYQNAFSTDKIKAWVFDDENEGVARRLAYLLELSIETITDDSLKELFCVNINSQNKN